MNATETKVCGRRVSRDASDGRGHCWRAVDRDDLPAQVVEEIEGEIVGGRTTCADFVGGNGQHYRW